MSDFEERFKRREERKLSPIALLYELACQYAGLINYPLPPEPPGLTAHELRELRRRNRARSGVDP